MELKVIEFPNRTLCVYKNEDRIYYSNVKFKWGRRKVAEIFNDQNVKLLEVGYHGFFSEKFKITFQYENLQTKILAINNSRFILENNLIIERKASFFNITNSKFSYFYNNHQIGNSKVINWVDTKKYTLDFRADELEIFELFIILILTYETGYSPE